MNNNKQKQTESRTDRAWKRLEPLLAGGYTGERPVSVPKNRWKYDGMAAAVLLTLFLGSVVHYRLSLLSYHNDRETPLLVALPDSTTVVLKKQASLTFSNGFWGLFHRKASLKGDGFFSVKHTRHHRAFFVDLENGDRIEVLGTSFSVHQQHMANEIVLTEGSIKLNLKNNNAIYMQPGDLITTNADGKVLRRQRTNARLYTAWLDDNVYFENLRLSDLLQWLERHYGLRYESPSIESLNKKVTGKLPIRDPELLKEGIEEVFHLRLIPIK